MLNQKTNIYIIALLVLSLTIYIYSYNKHYSYILDIIMISLLMISKICQKTPKTSNQIERVRGMTPLKQSGQWALLLSLSLSLSPSISPSLSLFSDQFLSGSQYAI
jgi:hypothetical protein